MTRASAILANLLLSFPLLTGLFGPTPSALAQSSATDKMTVTVPFAFSIGNRRFAPGSYSVERISSYALQVHSNTTKHGAFMMVRGEDGRGVLSSGRLVFEGTRGDMYLTQAWFAGTNKQYDAVTKPRRDLESAKQILLANPTAEVASAR